MRTRDILEETRREMGLSKASMSGAMGVSRAQYYNYLDGTSDVPLQKFIRLLDSRDYTMCLVRNKVVLKR